MTALKKISNIKMLIIAILTANICNAQSPYINRVYDYCPAPGQFINVLPKYVAGDTQQDMNFKAEECISGTNKVIISLGGYGGYIIFGFDHPVVNVQGEYDFKIFGNAFLSQSDGGNCEPGIVMVSYDTNGNGLPDDQWYELAGSEYYKPETVKNYVLTYHKPDEDKERVPMPGYPYINDMTYIKWESNQGEEGYMYRNTFHAQPYYPQWINYETLTFEGSKLADNYVDISGNGTNYIQYAFPYGYADNYPNTDSRSNFNIAWAVDETGKSVHLPAIHFVKVYTALNQYCGRLGETSTEISGAEDLHPSAIFTSITQNSTAQNLMLFNNPVKGKIVIGNCCYEGNVEIYDTMGRVVHKVTMSSEKVIDISHLPDGIYYLRTCNKIEKVVKIN